mgnify:CR=1 FL=1
MNNKDNFCDHPLKGTDVAFKAARSQLITDLISSLEKRFSDTTRGIFQATHIAKISSWPSAKTLEELESTVTHFLFVLLFCDFLNLSGTYIHLFNLPYYHTFQTLETKNFKSSWHTMEMFYNQLALYWRR